MLVVGAKDVDRICAPGADGLPEACFHAERSSGPPDDQVLKGYWLDEGALGVVTGGI